MASRLVLVGACAATLFVVGCSKRTAASIPAPPLPPQPAAQPAARPPAAAATNRPTAAPAAAAPQNRNISQQERAALAQSLARLEDALFDYDKSTIRDDAATALKQDVDVIRTTLVKYPSENIRLEGHADERGSAEYNLALGDRRAVSVKDFLVTMGVPTGQMATVSYGKEKPQCADENEACWQKNRRVHLELASN